MAKQYKFKVLRGTVKEGYNEDGTHRVYKASDVIETDTDLRKLDPTKQQYQLLHDAGDGE